MAAATESPELFDLGLRCIADVHAVLQQHPNTVRGAQCLRVAAPQVAVGALAASPVSARPPDALDLAVDDMAVALERGAAPAPIFKGFVVARSSTAADEVPSGLDRPRRRLPRARWYPRQAAVTERTDASLENFIGDLFGLPALLNRSPRVHVLVTNADEPRGREQPLSVARLVRLATERITFTGCAGVTHCGVSLRATRHLVLRGFPDMLQSRQPRGFGFAAKALRIVDLGGLEALELMHEDAFRDCAELQRVRLPGCCTTFGLRALSGCTALEEVAVDAGGLHAPPWPYPDGTPPRASRLPAGVREVGKMVFSGAAALKTVNLAACTELRVLDGHFLWGAAKLETVKLPPRLVSLGNAVLRSCHTLRVLDLRDLTELQTIGAAFASDCNRLEEVLLPSSVRSIDRELLVGCPALARFNLHELCQLEAIGDEALRGGGSIAELRGPPNLRSVGSHFATDCDELHALDFSACLRLELIGNRFAAGCPRLRHVRLPADVPSIGHGLLLQSGITPTDIQYTER